MIFYTLIKSFDASFNPYLLKYIVNKVAITKSDTIVDVLLFPSIGFVLFNFFVLTLFRIYDYYIEIRMLPELRKCIKNKIVLYLLNQGYYYYHTQFPGKIVNTINDLSENIPEIIQLVLTRCFLQVLTLLGIFLTLWTVHLQFALLLLAWIFVFLIIVIIFSKKILLYAHQWSDIRSTITGHLVDILGNILSVKVYARENFENNNIEANLQKEVKAEQKLQWSYFWIWLIYGNVFVLFQGIILYFLIDGYQRGFITLGDFSLVLTLNIKIVDSIWEFTRDFAKVLKNGGRIVQGINVLPNTFIVSSFSKEATRSRDSSMSSKSSESSDSLDKPYNLEFNLRGVEARVGTMLWR